MRVLILDNEAVSALRDAHHPHHKRVLGLVEANRPVRRADKDRRTVVPTAVRVEASWDRAEPSAAPVNRLRIQDVELDERAANVAARLHRDHPVSVADAHVGAAIHRAPSTADICVITSDPTDMSSVAESRKVTIISL